MRASRGGAPDGLTTKNDVGRLTFTLLNAHDPAQITVMSNLLQPYIDAGTRKSGLPRKQKRATGPQRDLNDVRAFARAKGHKVADRGRIPQHILDEYDRENGGKS